MLKLCFHCYEDVLLPRFCDELSKQSDFIITSLQERVQRAPASSEALSLRNKESDPERTHGDRFVLEGERPRPWPRPLPWPCPLPCGRSKNKDLFFRNSKKIRMRFSIVENLSGLSGNIFSLFRRPQLHFNKKIQKLVELY